MCTITVTLSLCFHYLHNLPFHNSIPKLQSLQRWFNIADFNYISTTATNPPPDHPISILITTALQGSRWWCPHCRLYEALLSLSPSRRFRTNWNSDLRVPVVLYVLYQPLYSLHVLLEVVVVLDSLDVLYYLWL